MKINLLVVVFLFAMVAVFSSCNSQNVSSAKIKTDLDSVGYIIGHNMGNQMKAQLPDVDPAVIAKGIQDALAGKDNALFTDPSAIDTYMRTYFTNLQQKISKNNLEKGQKFLEENKKKSGVTTTESGLQYEVLVEGTGVLPSDTSTVKVHYHGTTIDGKVFDSSVDSGEPSEFSLNGVIPGFSEGIKLMKVGSKYKFYIPSELAYGEQQRSAEIGPNSVLIFEIELLEIVE